MGKSVTVSRFTVDSLEVDLEEFLGEIENDEIAEALDPDDIVEHWDADAVIDALKIRDVDCDNLAEKLADELDETELREFIRVLVQKHTKTHDDDKVRVFLSYV